MALMLPMRSLPGRPSTPRCVHMGICARACMHALQAFYIALYILYPRANGFYDVGFVVPFNNWYDAALAVVQLAFLGVNFELNIDVLFETELSLWQEVDLVCFGVLYIAFILFSIILLLNLLIAMLAFTFEEVREDSTLECRLSFARHVLRLETYAGFLGFNCRVGMATDDGRYVHEFRIVEGKGGKGGKAGADDPFCMNDDDSPSLADINRQLKALSEQVARSVGQTQPPPETHPFPPQDHAHHRHSHASPPPAAICSSTYSPPPPPSTPPPAPLAGDRPRVGPLRSPAPAGQMPRCLRSPAGHMPHVHAPSPALGPNLRAGAPPSTVHRL